MEPEMEQQDKQALDGEEKSSPKKPQKPKKRNTRTSKGAKSKGTGTRKRKKFADGDIVAEGVVGEEIWDGKAVVTRRALGVVHIDEEVAGRKKGVDPETTGGCEVQEIRAGVAKLTEKAEPWMREEMARNGLMAIHLSVLGDQFLAWDQAEKVGSVEDMPD